MSMYDMFKTDTDRERNGIFYEGDGFRIKVARAGGANKRYAKMLEVHTRPYRRALQTETMGNERALELLYHVYADAVVLDWEVWKNGKWEQGIEGEDGEILPFNRENVIQTFKNLPDLFTDVQEQAGRIALFRQDIIEKDAGN